MSKMSIDRNDRCVRVRNRRSRRHDPSVAYEEKLDAKLPDGRKAWVYEKIMHEIAARLCRKGVNCHDADEIASTIYYDLMDRKSEDMFHRGIPETDAEWMAFLMKTASFAFMAHRRSAWRHQTVSIDAPVQGHASGETEDGGETTLLDMLSDNLGDGKQYRPEAMDEMRNVRKAVALVCKRRGYKPATRRVVERAFLEEESVAQIAAACKMTANNVSRIKFQFNDAIRKDGLAAMAVLERLADVA